MDSKAIRYFITVAEELNFTKAAEQLYITQSTLSHNIAELEKSLGVKLFDRTTRSVKLTPAGIYLYENAKDIDEKIQMLFKGVRKFQEGIRGELKVGYLFWPYIDLIAEFSNSFRNKYQDIQVSFNQYNARDLSKALEKEIIDIAFGTSIEFEDNGKYSIKTIERDSPCIVLNKQHPLCQCKDFRISMLENEPLAMLSRCRTPGFFDFFCKLCDNNGFSPTISCQLEQIESIFVQVLTGQEIGVITTNMSYHAEYQNIDYIEIKDKGAYFYNVAAYKKSNKNASLQLFLDELNQFSVS